MNLKFLFLIFIFCLNSLSFGQKNEYLLFIKDKPLTNTESLSLNFSSKANLKKNKTGFDLYDLPVSSLYLQQLKTKGKVINKSKWLNAVHYSSELSIMEIQASFSFITNYIVLNPEEKKTDFTASLEQTQDIADTSLYNNSYEQLEITNTISCMHDRGFDGSGVLVAVIDAGFPKLDSMNAFKKMRNEGRIIDTWDFEDNTSYVYHKSNHGTFVSSIIGAEVDSSFIGSSPKADYAFYITEITRFERNIEEFNLVLGLERADSIGADICTISLGYRNFDTLQLSYDYSAMDGNTTVVAQGVKIARNKGIIISAAAGNSGPGAGTLSSPCDVDSILCIGAIDFDSTRAIFSSEGPTADGRIKPDVVTIGRHCYYIRLDDSVRNGNGTSFATPLFSGLVACLKQAHPFRTNFEIIQAIKENSHLSNNPDNVFGYGIPNGCKIDSALSVIDANTSSPEIKNKLNIAIYPNPATSEINIATKDLISEISIINLDGKLLKKESIQFSKPSYRTDVSNLKKGVYLVLIKGNNGSTITKKIILN